ncbi:hypothetical protein TSUD_231570 [Trifolium subterraneum]|nr:hypothetical protein TSUD_231570 [Trifolium subterraneum]
MTVELKKQISSSLQLSNKTDSYVAFKVKTTNPKKYCVRPNTGVVLPRSTCDVIVTMQAQKEAPPDMQCKDKFLLQSTMRAFTERNESAEAKALMSRLTEEKNNAIQQNNKLRQELDLLKRESSKSRGGASMIFVILIGLLGIIMGYLLKKT